MRRLLSLLTGLVLVLLIATGVFAHEKSPPDSAANTYFISFESKVDKNVIKTHGGEIKHQYKYMPVIAAKLPDKILKMGWTIKYYNTRAIRDKND